MPLYFFDVRDIHGLHRDDVGVELSNMEAALAEGRRALADMSRDTLSVGVDQQLEILIRDHGEGPIRLVLSLKTEGPGEDVD